MAEVEETQDVGRSNEEVALERTIAEEYKVWKKNSPFLYDTVMTHSLDWPSLTVEWFKDVNKPRDRDVNIHKLLLGTHTSEGETNYLMIADISLPKPDAEIVAKAYDDSIKEVGGFGGVLSKIDCKIKMVHEGEVNKARICPHNQFIIASKSPSSAVFLFDYAKHPSMPSDNICRPNLKLLGHEKEGYGLSWNPHDHHEGYLLSGSDDNLICIWDTKSQQQQPLQKRQGHNDVVEDVDWHRHYPQFFGSVGDDGKLMIWDTRKEDGAVHDVKDAHTTDVNCLSFNPFNEFLVATGGLDQVVKLWDMRNMTEVVHEFEGHEAGVFQIQWSPFSETVMGSCSADRRINIWDMSRIGDEQTPEDALDGPPELLFTHGGHTAKVSDFGWHQNDEEEWMIASVAEDNILQIWQMAENIYNDEPDDEDVDDEDLEAEDEGPDTKKAKSS